MSSSLRRKLLRGKKYEALLPKVKCEQLFIGKGDTDFSISKMKEAVEKFNHQTKAIATLLQASTLQELCSNVHFFAYWHFDYDADSDDQMLRSPACSWYHRYKGIDCKSYSIIASCILTNLGINHFIRKVSYATPGQFTHVYVIVPQNQNVTQWEEIGEYYMIDGTINTFYENEFIDVRDEFMSGMPHYFLNGPADQYQYSQLNGIADIFNVTKTILGTIKGIFASINCIGGSWYDKAQQEATHAAIINFVAGKVNAINVAVTAKNWPQLSIEVQDLIGVLRAADANFSIKKGEGWNPCTTRNLEDTDVFLEFLATKAAGQTLTAWINQYFTTTPNGSKSYNCNDFEYNLGFTGCWVGNPAVVSVEGLSFTPKNVDIKAFEINDYTQYLATGAQFNLQDFINSLDTVVITATQFLPNNGNGGGVGTDPGASYEYIDDAGGQQQQAGFGKVAGAILALVLLGYAFTTTEDKVQPKKDLTDGK